MTRSGEIHANAGDTWNARARCGAPLEHRIASARSGGATNNPGLVTCPECLRGQLADHDTETHWRAGPGAPRTLCGAPVVNTGTGTDTRPTIVAAALPASCPAVPADRGGPMMTRTAGGEILTDSRRSRLTPTVTPRYCQSMDTTTPATANHKTDRQRADVEGAITVGARITVYAYSGRPMHDGRVTRIGRTTRNGVTTAEYERVPA